MTTNTDELNQLLTTRTFRAEFMAVDDCKLRIFLQGCESGECALLAVEPRVLVLPDEVTLDYSLQDVSLELGPPPSERLYDLATRTGPDFDKGELPGLFQ